MAVKIRTKKLSDGRLSIYLDKYVDGKREYEFLKLYLGPDAKSNKDTKRLAEVIRAKREQEIGMGGHGIPVLHRQRANFIDYMNVLAAQRSTATKSVWRAAIGRVKDYVDDRPVPFSSLTPAWLKGLRSYLLAKVSQNSAVTYFAIVRTAVRQAYIEEHLPSNPCDKVDGIDNEQTEREHLLYEELVQLAKTPCRNDEVRRAFLYACYTGLRYSDVAKLCGRDISNERLRFRQKKTKAVEYMHLSQQALVFVRPGIEPDELVFKLPSYWAMNNILKQWAADAELSKKITFHVARHTAATLMLTNNVDLYTVSKVLGHSSIQVTQRYAHMIDQKKKEALDAIPPLPMFPLGTTA